MLNWNSSDLFAQWCAEYTVGNGLCKRATVPLFLIELWRKRLTRACRHQTAAQHMQTRYRQTLHMNMDHL